MTRRACSLRLLRLIRTFFALVGEAGQERDASLTRTGMAIGTAGYMSPEQIKKERLDARTDLFSFGLVLYEMATGQRAFAGDTAEAVHRRFSIRLRLQPRMWTSRFRAD